MKRGFIQPDGASAWESKAAHEKLGFATPGRKISPPRAWKNEFAIT